MLKVFVLVAFVALAAALYALGTLEKVVLVFRGSLNPLPQIPHVKRT